LLIESSDRSETRSLGGLLDDKQIYRCIRI
jgi:hypothetical protein